MFILMSRIDILGVYCETVIRWTHATPLMIGAIMKQAITWANVDLDIYRYMA